MLTSPNIALSCPLVTSSPPIAQLGVTTDSDINRGALQSLPDGVFEPLTALTGLDLRNNRSAPFAPTADAQPDDGTVSSAGGRVTLDGNGSDGGPWGTNVTYSWRQTSGPTSGVRLNDDASVTPEARIPALAAETVLIFTLTVTGRGGEDERGVAPAADTAKVTVLLDPTAGVCGRTPAVRDALIAELGVTLCGAVSDADLASITELTLSGQEFTALAAGDFAGLTSLETLRLTNTALTALPGGVFDGLNALTALLVNGNNTLTALSPGAFAGLTSLETLWLNNNALENLPDGVFAGLTSLKTLRLENNELATLPDDVFEPLTALTTLDLLDNDGAPFSPEAVARPDDGTVPVAGGMVTLDGSDSGGAWGTNVTYGWALTDPASGVTVKFDDAASVMPKVTIQALAAGTELTFTLTVTGRGGTSGIDPATDSAKVTSTASDDATLGALTVNDGTGDLTLDPTFAPGTFAYAAEVGKAVTTVTLTAMKTDDGASVSGVTLNGNAIADSDFTNGITVPSLLVGDNDIVVTVTAENGASQTYTVTVTRTNSAPTASDGSVTTDEDTAHTFAAVEFNFVDPDAGDALASVTVVTLPAAGGLALDGTAVTLDQAVPAAKIGDLVFTPEANANGMGYASFTFKVSDGTEESALAYMMTVNVTAVNDPATGMPTISGTARVGETLTAVTTGIADADGPASPTYGYQWIRVDADGTSNATDVVGETADTYIPVEADDGKKIRVKVSFTDDDSTDEELTSDAFPSSGTIEVSADICGRTGEVRRALLALISSVSNCADVTATHLAAIGTLDLSNRPNLTALAAGDFAGLTSLTDLWLYDNSLARLPARVFDGLTSLRVLNLFNNDLATLPAGVFDGLTELRTLRLFNNDLATLPDGVFDGLTELRTLRLEDNFLATLPDGVFAGLTSLTRLGLYANKLTTLPDGVFAGLTSLTTLGLYDNFLATLPDGVFAGLTALRTLNLSDNFLATLDAGVFDGLTALETLNLSDNSLARLPARVFAELTALTGLSLTGNDGTPFSPKAVALPDDGTVSNGGGTVTLDGSRSGGPWGTNVTYGWALTAPTSGVTVRFDDDASATTLVTIEALAAETVLTFTLTVTGRGGTDGITPGTDTAKVTVTGPPASDDATLSGLTVNDGTSDLTLDPTFASAKTSYAAEVANAVTTVRLTAMTTDDGASVSAVTLSGIAIADSDFTDGITVPSLLVGDNAIIVTVTAEDTSSTQTYTVTVTRAANNAPTASDGSVTTDEDTAHTFAEDEFNFADPDAGDALASVRVVTLPTAGALALDGTAATVDQAVPAAKIRDLVFTPEANANGMGYASFTFRVSDGTDESALAYMMTVNVTAVDDPATGGPSIRGTAWVGGTLRVATTDIADLDGLTSPTYGYQWIRVDDDGTSNATDIAGETSDTYTLMDADVGKKIRVKVSFTDDAGGDEELTSDAYPSNGTVEAAPNAAPLFTSPSAFDAAENQTAVGTVTATDSDDSVTNYTIKPGEDGSTFAIEAATGVLTFRSAPNFEAPTDADRGNDYVVEVRATSGTGARVKTADQTITVTVTDEVGEAPGVPAKPTVTSASVTSVTVTWAAPSNPGPAITSYDLQYRVGDSGDFTPWTEDVSGTSATITGLAENTEYEVQVQATNAEGTGDWSEAGSGSTDANAAPLFTSPSAFDAAENQTAVGTVTATDSDDSVTNYTIKPGEDGSTFAIEAATGVLTFRSAPNFEAPTDADRGNDYVVEVRATSGTGARVKTADQTITVTVTDEVGEAPGVPAKPTVTSASVTSVTVTWAAPSNPGPAITSYDLQYRVGDSGDFTPWTEDVSGTSATITGLAENTEYEVQVQATNAEGTGDWSEAGSGSTDANAAPLFTSPSAFDAAENQTAVGTVTATDSDDSVTNYTIKPGEDGSTFAIEAATGVLTFRSAPNFEAPTDADRGNDYVVEVRATSGTGARVKTADQTITVTVTDEVGEAPGVPAKPTVTSASVTSVTVTWAAPSNPGPAITSYDLQYRVGDSGDFTPWTEDVSGTSATITGLAENTEYEVQVQATNAEGTGDWSEAGSGSTDANAAPLFTSPSAFDAAENQTAVGTVTATDSDDSVTNYTIKPGEDGSTFAIEAATGVLTFRSAPNFEAPTDADRGNDYVVEVRATSGTGARVKTADQTITVTVTDEVGEAPGVPAKPTVTSASVTSVTVTWAAPSNPGPAITSYDLQYRVGDSGDFTPWTEDVSGTSATITGLAENTEYEVQVQATNAEGTGDWSEAGSGSTDANAAPLFTSPSAFDAAENQTAVGTVTATDSDDSVTNYTIKPGEDGSTFAIEAATGVLTFRSAPNFEAPTDADRGNDYVVEVRATSGTGARVKTADQTITVTVTDEVGEAPGVPAKPTVTSASVTSVTVTWAAPSNPGPAITSYDLQYRVGDSGDFTPWTEDVSGTSATITGLAENTEYEVQVQATNAEGTGDWSEAGSGSTDANAAPLFTSPSAFDAAENQTAVGTVTATDSDDSVTNYTIKPGEDGSTFAIEAATGVLTFRSAPNFEAPTDADRGNDYVVEVRATSGTGARVKTADQTITVTVTDEVGEAPGVPAKPTVTSASVTSVTVTWAAPSNPGPAITSYDLQYRVGDSGDFTPWTEDVSGTSATITGLAENTEYEVQVQATNAEGTGGWSDSGSGSTDANAAPGLTLTVEAEKDEVTEGEPVRYRILMSRPTSGAMVESEYSYEGEFVHNGPASVFTGVSSQNGMLYWEIEYETLDDAMVEEDGSFTVRIQKPDVDLYNQGEVYTVGTPSSATVTILDNDPEETPTLPIVSVFDVRVDEGPGAVLAFPVRLNVAAVETATIEWETLDGSAKAGQDYNGASGTLVFSPGDTEKTVRVEVIDDTLVEGTELLLLLLLDAQGAVIDDAVAKGTIKDNDAASDAADDALEDALTLVDDLTPGVAAAVLLGEQTLGEAELAALDRLGNRNGRYDLGDLLSWIDRCRRGEARCGRTSTDSGPAAAALLGGAAAGGRSTPKRPGRRDSGRRGRASTGGIRRRARMAGQVLAVLLAATTAWSCTEGSVAPVAPKPDPGFLTVEWSGPATHRDVGVLLELEGPTIDAVRAPGLELYESSSPGPRRIVVAGVLRPGPLVQLRVPDRNQFALYRVRVLQVTGEGYGLRDPTEYRAVVIMN